MNASAVSPRLAGFTIAPLTDPNTLAANNPGPIADESPSPPPRATRSLRLGSPRLGAAPHRLSTPNTTMAVAGTPPVAANLRTGLPTPSPQDPGMRSATHNDAKVVGFYGYKDVGQATCVAGVAALLVEQGARVLVIDGFLDAPGLSLSAAYADLLLDTPGLIQLLLGELTVEEAISNAPEVPTKQFIREPVLGGRLSLLGAGIRRSTSGPGINTQALIKELDELSALTNYEGSIEGVEKLWTDLIQQLKASGDFDVIIVNTPTGFAQFGGMMLGSCDVGVFMCGLNQQNILGTASVLRDLNSNGSPKPRLVVPTSVPTSATRGLDEAWKMFEEVLSSIHKGGQERLSLPYSGALMVNDDPQKYMKDKEFHQALLKLTNAIRDALSIGVKDLLIQLHAQMSEGGAETAVAKMKEILVQLARINGLEDMLNREGQLWQMPSVPITLAHALADAVEYLKTLGDEVSDDIILQVATLWVRKLRFSHPSADSERVLALYEYLINQIDNAGWTPLSKIRTPKTVIARLQVDSADAILHHQRHQVINSGEPVDLEALARAESALRQIDNNAEPDTVLRRVQAITHLVRMLPEDQLLQEGEGGVTRIQSLATLAESQLARLEGHSQYKTWSDDVTVGLAIAWPSSDPDEQQRRVEEAIQLTYDDNHAYRGRNFEAAYDRAILYLRVNKIDEAKAALQALKFAPDLKARALKDPDLAPLWEHIKSIKIIN